MPAKQKVSADDQKAWGLKTHPDINCATFYDHDHKKSDPPQKPFGIRNSLPAALKAAKAQAEKTLVKDPITGLNQLLWVRAARQTHPPAHALMRSSFVRLPG